MSRKIDPVEQKKRTTWALELYKAHYSVAEAAIIIKCPPYYVTLAYKKFKLQAIKKHSRARLMPTSYLPIMAAYAN